MEKMRAAMAADVLCAAAKLALTGCALELSCGDPRRFLDVASWAPVSLLLLAMAGLLVSGVMLFLAVELWLAMALGHKVSGLKAKWPAAEEEFQHRTHQFLLDGILVVAGGVSVAMQLRAKSTQLVPWTFALLAPAVALIARDLRAWFRLPAGLRARFYRSVPRATGEREGGAYEKAPLTWNNGAVGHPRQGWPIRGHWYLVRKTLAMLMLLSGAVALLWIVREPGGLWRSLDAALVAFGAAFAIGGYFLWRSTR